eukprot:1352465-Pleurochrysis_carterae.AAC.2
MLWFATYVSSHRGSSHRGSSQAHFEDELKKAYAEVAETLRAYSLYSLYQRFAVPTNTPARCTNTPLGVEARVAVRARGSASANVYC